MQAKHDYEKDSTDAQVRRFMCRSAADSGSWPPIENELLVNCARNHSRKLGRLSMISID